MLHLDFEGIESSDAGAAKAVVASVSNKTPSPSSHLKETIVYSKYETNVITHLIVFWHQVESKKLI